MSVIAEEIKSIILLESASLNSKDLTIEANFSDLGIDSLELFSILLAIEEKYDIKIPEDKIDSLGSVNEIVEYLSSEHI